MAACLHTYRTSSLPSPSPDGCTRPRVAEIVKKFADNEDVRFGDSNLADGGSRGGDGASPGAGGWPTIRYYNKEVRPASLYLPPSLHRSLP